MNGRQSIKNQLIKQRANAKHNAKMIKYLKDIIAMKQRVIDAYNENKVIYMQQVPDIIDLTQEDVEDLTSDSEDDEVVFLKAVKVV
nr:hypothetical protein [Cressdnaviricota sp.]